jgi:hypothetical protein
MILFRSLLISTLLLSAISCAPLPAKYDFDTNVDFSQYKSYQWQNRTQRTETISDNSLLEKRIHSITEQKMIGRGLDLVKGKADFLLTHHIVTHERLDVRDYGTDYFWPYRRRPMADIYQYTEGTLIIDMLDAKTEALIWRGWATQAINQPSIPQQQLEQILGQIFDKFPL